MREKVAPILWVVLLTFIFSIGMSIIGMFFGGNYITNVEFFGTIGYEAGGNFGFLLGLIIGPILFAYIYRKMFKKNK